MHVLYFHQHFSTPDGSAGTRSYEMAQALLRSGHSVTMVCGSYAQGKTGLTEPFTRGRRRGMIDGIDIIELNVDYSNHMAFSKRIATFLKFAFDSVRVAMTEPADVVFATSTPLTAGIPGIFARWFRRKTFVFEVRDLWPELPKAMGVIKNPIILKLMSFLEWASYSSAHRLIGLSPGIVQGIAGRGVKNSLIEMVPNGCDLRLFSTPKSAWRPVGVSDKDLLAIFTGTHGAANGLDAVLDAAADLKTLGREDIKLALVGQGSEKGKLQQRAQDENLTNVFFLDPLPKTKLTELMAGADIGLQVLRNVPAFYFGTSPNKFFDYISSGLPVLNNYPGWLADMIEESKCGFAVQPDDSMAFAQALITAADNRHALLEMGTASKKLATDAFSREILAVKWVHWVTATTSK